MNENENWKERVDERLGQLTTSETVQNDRLDDLGEQVREVERTIDGDPKDRKDNGVVGDVERHENTLIRLTATMLPDALGKGGVINDLAEIKRELKSLKTQRGFRWKFYTAITGGLILLAREVIQDLPQIKALFGKGPESKVEQMINNAKHPRRHHTRVRPVPAPEVNDDSTANQILPEGRGGDGAGSR